MVEQYVFPAIMEVIDPHHFGGILRSLATHALRQMNDHQALYSEKSCTQKSPVLRKALYSATSGAQNRFLSIGLDDHSSLLSYIQALTILKTKNCINYY